MNKTIEQKNPTKLNFKIFLRQRRSWECQLDLPRPVKTEIFTCYVPCVSTEMWVWDTLHKHPSAGWIWKQLKPRSPGLNFWHPHSGLGNPSSTFALPADPTRWDDPSARDNERTELEAGRCTGTPRDPPLTGRGGKKPSSLRRMEQGFREEQDPYLWS